MSTKWDGIQMESKNRERILDKNEGNMNNVWTLVNNVGLFIVINVPL